MPILNDLKDRLSEKNPTPAYAKMLNYILDAFISDGGDVNQVLTDKKETALHLAAKYGHAKIVSRLCELGADLEAKTNEGLTPRMLALKIVA